MAAMVAGHQDCLANIVGIEAVEKLSGVSRREMIETILMAIDAKAERKLTFQKV